jgi:arabinan endo-1,5-alpha-L-arabinosidase
MKYVGTSLQMGMGHFHEGSQVPSAVHERFYIGVSSGKVLVDFTTSETANNLLSPLLYNDNLWHHICISYSNKTATMYVDGITVASRLFTVVSNVSNKTPQIGRMYRTDIAPASYFNGSIDQVRIFNRALTADEVSTLYLNENNVI